MVSFFFGGFWDDEKAVCLVLVISLGIWRLEGLLKARVFLFFIESKIRKIESICFFKSKSNLEKLGKGLFG